MMWILLTKPMQKSVTTVCLHCSFARLKNKHIGVLGINVATTSWLHWSSVSGYNFPVTFCQGFGAKFGRLNSEEAQKTIKFLPLNFLCYTYRNGF